MCTVCGCSEGETSIESHEHSHEDGTTHSHTHSHKHDHGHAHSHTHDSVHMHGQNATHSHTDAAQVDNASQAHFHRHEGDMHYGLGPAHAHVPGMSQARMVQIEQDILGKNNAYAAVNRQSFAEHGIFAVNMVSSPGSGKTTLLVKSIEMLKGKAKVAVVEGDQQTTNDADRIRATGAPAIQVNTGKGCHLDAHMVGNAVARLNLANDSLLMIENVGNLVCPSAFDLGEAHKVVILSVTEGEEKPMKYPDMFNAADLMILNKIDLLPYLNFDVDKCIGFALRVNPKLQVIQLSATSGKGMDEWINWLLTGLAEAKDTRVQNATLHKIEDSIETIAETDNVALLQKRIAELEAQLARNT